MYVVLVIRAPGYRPSQVSLLSSDEWSDVVAVRDVYDYEDVIVSRGKQEVKMKVEVVVVESTRSETMLIV